MKNEDSYILAVVILVTVLYLYNSGRFTAIKRIIDDKTYQYNFGLTQGIKVTEVKKETGDIFQSIASGLSDVLKIGALFG